MNSCPHCKEVLKTIPGRSDRLIWIICDACNNVFVRSKDPKHPATMQDAIDIMLEEKKRKDFNSFFAPIAEAIEKALS